MTEDLKSDVTIVGGGLSGLAASIHLAKAGFEVLCFEPAIRFDRMVGESLDWSAPELFKEFGLEMDELVQSNISTYKRHVVLKREDESQAEYSPSEWLGEPPWNIRLRTLHVDRMRLHGAVTRIVASHGVRIIHDRVMRIERKGQRITAAETAAGRRVSSTWFIDASGSAASFLGRALDLSYVEYGPRKIAIWTQFKNSDWREGTTLFSDVSGRSYMEWVWEIPINSDTVSIGYVATAETIKRARDGSLSVEGIFKRQLSKFSRLRQLLPDDMPELNVTSFRCRTFNRVCGPNWIIIGEAASVPDPITGNGVTAALRHATEAAKLIQRHKTRGYISWWARTIYSLRVRHMGRFFNSLIEKIAYDWPIRDRIGLLKAGDVYTIPAWSVNHLYSRIQPRGMFSTVLFSLFLDSIRGITWLFYHGCRLLPSQPQMGVLQPAT